MDTEHDNYFSKWFLNSESSALLKTSDMVGTVLSQKPRRLQRFRNEQNQQNADCSIRKNIVSFIVNF